MKEKEMIFGIRAVIEAVEAGKDIDKVMVKRELSGDLFIELQQLLRTHEIPMQRVPVERIDRVTRKNHQGVIAFTAAVTYQRLENIVPLLYEEGKTPFILLLDGLTDVRNFGAIARTCEVAGVHAIVIPERGSVTVNADAIKTSAGALHTIPVCREQSLKEAEMGKALQFEREGYFCLDSRYSTPEHLVFNRTVGLRDTWAKTGE